MITGIPSIHPHVNLRSGVPCSCLIGHDHEEPPRYSESQPTQWGARKISEPAESILDTFVSNAYRVHVAAVEDDLKDVIRRAIQLVEENPRNEAIRTPISRPAVERMLTEDIDDSGAVRDIVTSSQAAELAHELFDAGWRPTIERLAR